MTQEEKKNKRNGMIGTVVFHSALLILFLFVGLSYYDPPIEDGIAINFGYTPEGAGETTQAPEEIKPTPQQEVVEETTPIDEEVVTQEVEDAPAISEEKPKTKQVEKPKEPQPEPDPQPTNDLLNRLNKVKNSTGEGEGETQGGGDQGDPNGDPNSDNRTGGGGFGNSGNYRLGNRKALARPKPTYDCPDEGRVVVKIYVNRSGKVQQAVPGERIPDGGPASTTASQCLFRRAQEAALKTTWQGDPNAPDQQIGYIIYNFSKT